jgi:hypothetical protein
MLGEVSKKDAYQKSAGEWNGAFFVTGAGYDICHLKTATQTLNI